MKFGGLDSLWLIGDIDIKDGQWHHVAFVYDGIMEYLYIDGNLDVSQAATGNLYRSPSQLIMGEGGFSGQLDDVRVYPIGLSQSQVQAAMNGSVPDVMDAATVTMTVMPVNDTPVAVTDAYEGSINDPLSIPAPGVLANDSDVEMTPLSATVTLPPAIGDLSLASDGGFIYTPTVDFTGLVTYTYTASDGELSSSATVSMTIGDNRCYTYLSRSGQGYDSYDASAIQDGIDNAQAGEVIKIAGYCPIILDSNGQGQSISLNQSVTLQGGYTHTNWLAAPDPVSYPTILDGRGLARVIYGSYTDVTLSNLTITNGLAETGAGVYLDTSVATLSNTLLISNSATSWGGGLYGVASAITVQATQIVSNSAGSSGGGIYITSGFLLVEQDSEVAYNQSNTSSGGGIYVHADGHIVIDDSWLHHNQADGKGGGVYASYYGPEIRNSVIEYNISASHGGGVYARYNTILETSQLAHNHADEYGGGIYLDASGLYMTSTLVYSNTADYGGGIGFGYYGGIVMRHSLVQENFATFDGGGLILEGEGGVIVEDSAFRGNVAGEDGGGIALQYEITLLAERNSFVGNVAGLNGGAVSMGETDANNGDIRNSTFAQNEAGQYGGAIFAHQPIIGLEYSTIVDNEAGSAGGGLYSDPAFYAAAQNSIVAGNSVAGSQSDPTADCSSGAAFHSGGYNLFGTSTGCTVTRYDRTVAAADLFTMELAPLADNGGALLPDGTHPQTFALLNNSSAIDAGEAVFCPGFDARNNSRPQGNGCDVGAFESGFTAVVAPLTDNIITVTTTIDEVAGNGNCSLREAVQAANMDTAVDGCVAGDGWDTISLAAGTYALTITTTGQLLITDSVTIAGVDGTTTFIDGVGNDRVLYANGVTLYVQGVTVQNGRASNEDGGCAYLHHSLTRLNNSIISGCMTTGSSADGGGIYMDGGVLRLHNSQVKNNVGYDGGGIYNNKGVVSLSASTLQNNVANSNSEGGGYYHYMGSFRLYNSQILSNTSGVEGGGVFVEQGTLVLYDNSEIAYNQSGHDGGGIHIFEALAAIDDSAVHHNRTDQAGGGAYFTEQDGGSWIRNSQIMYNSSDTEGGGIYGSSWLQNSTIAHNQAIAGGGLYGWAALENSMVEANESNQGGGLYATGLSIYSSQIQYNQVVSDTAVGGGGMYVDGDGGGAYFVDSTIQGNTTLSAGGGIYAQDAAGSVIGRNSTVSGNSSAEMGGGLYSQLGVVDLQNSTVSGNDAGVAGGVAVVSGTLSLDFVTVAGNTAITYTGGIYNGNSTIIQNSIVAGNSVGGDINQATADCQAAMPISFAGYSLFGNGTGCVANGFGDMIVDPAVVWTAVLGSLADNGGTNQTHALLTGSPAVDAVPVEVCTVAADQRHVSRPQLAACDMGAYEVANEQPVAVDDAYQTMEDVTLMVAAPGVLSNDSEPNNEVLTASLQSAPSHGTLSLNSDGAFVYTPTADFYGVDTFVYIASDGLLMDVATVTITVEAVDTGFFIYLPFVAKP